MFQALAITLAIAGTTPQSTTGSATKPAATKPVSTAEIAAVQRIVVIGASVSDGFGLDGDVGVKTTFADIVSATLKGAHAPVRSTTNAMFFAAPDAAGVGLLKTAADVEPTLVVAIDYLFWFGYGDLPNDEARLALLDRGLKSLETFQCPVLVGDFPDMSLALDVKDNPMPLLSKAQVPAPETIEKLNRRVRAWAVENPRRIVVKVSELVRRLRANEEFALRRNTWFQGSLEFLLQRDRLHPTLQGSIALWIHALDELVRAEPAIPESAFLWDAKEIWRAVYNSKEAERQALAQQKLDKLIRERAPPPEPPPPPPGTIKKPRDG